MFLTRTQKPSALPFELALLKKHCRVSTSLDDAILEFYAWAAIRQGEFDTNRVWVESVWTAELDEFPRGVIEIPLSPCTGVTSITYIDADGETQTLDPAGYRVRPSSLEWDGGRPYALIASIGAWPVGSSVCITFKAGWEAQDLPEEMVQWTLIKVSSRYEQREDLASATRKIAIGFPRNFADALLDSYYLPKRTF